MRTVAIMQPTYWGRCHVFNRIVEADVLVWLDHVQHSRDPQKWDDRALLVDRHGQEVQIRLSRRHVGEFQRWCDVELADEKWRNHAKTIQMCYGRSRHWPMVAGFVDMVYATTADRLNTVCLRTLAVVMEMLDVRRPIVRSSTLTPPQGDQTERLIDMCRQVDADRLIAGGGARDGYVDVEKMEGAGIEPVWQNWAAPLAASGPVPDPSVLDVIAWKGRDGARQALD